MKFFTAMLAICLLSMPVRALQSGADTGGYFYKDSNELDFYYDFNDISSNAGRTDISLSDDQSKLISLGFAFRFYDTTYNSVYVSSNGFISFTSSNNGCCSGRAIPSSSALGAGIAAWWEDLNPRNGGSVAYEVMGSAPNRHIIIQFTGVPAYSNSGRNTFQYKLFESDGRIEVHYKEVYGDNGNYTVGIQQNSTVGLQRYFGSGGSTQNQTPDFVTPYAIQYKNPDVYYKNSSETSHILAPASQQAINIVLSNSSAADQDVAIEYSSGAQLILSGETHLTINAQDSFTLQIQAQVLAGAEGLQTSQLTVSSPTGEFESFMVPLTIFVYQFSQISYSSTNASEAPSLSDDGERVLLLSRDDLAGTGKSNTSTDVFLYDVKRAEYTQVTYNQIARHCQSVKISGNGKWGAAVCNSDLDNVKNNADASYELFIFNLELQSVKQVYDNASLNMAVDDLAFDHNGNTLIFVSNDNHSGENASGHEEVFAYSLKNDTTKQLTFFRYNQNVSGVDLDYAGNRFVVAARGNPLGLNSSRSWQIFSGEVNKGLLWQLTPNGKTSQSPKMSANGEKVVFSSNATFINGSSLPRSAIYMADFKGEGFELIASSLIYNALQPDVSADASSVIFLTQASLVGANASANQEVFLHNIRQSKNIQLTEVNENRDVSYVSFAANGSAIGFSGDGDWDTAQNPSRVDQTFLINRLPDVPVKAFEESSTALPVIEFENDEYSKIQTGAHGYYFMFALMLLIIRRRC